MKKTDIGVVAVIYAICALFLSMTVKLDKAAQIYPLTIITVLFVLTTMFLIKMIMDYKKNGVVSGLEKFEGFIPKQFFGLFVMMVGYLVLMYIAGFYISTFVFMVASLLFLRVKKWQIGISVLAIIALVYFAFTKFLGVHLPAGLLFM